MQRVLVETIRALTMHEFAAEALMRKVKALLERVDELLARSAALSAEQEMALEEIDALLRQIEVTGRALMRQTTTH